MRDFGQLFQGMIDAPGKQVKHVIELETTPIPPEFNTNIMVFIQGEAITWTLGAPVVNQYAGTIEKVSGLSQRVDRRSFRSSIGNFKADIVDVGSLAAGELARLMAGDSGQRLGKVRIYIGFDGFEQADFQLMMTASLKRVEGVGKRFTLFCSDLTRQTKKTIFRVGRSRLASSISKTETTIPAEGTLAEFATIQHTAGWQDAPNEAAVGYFKIRDEIVRFTGISGGSFTGCVRGAFNTDPEAYQVDTGSQGQEPPAITEFIYLEGNALMLLRALLTGEYVDGATVFTLPDRWHAGLVAAADLELPEWGPPNLQLSTYDPSDAFSGRVVRLWGMENMEAKSFIERELLPIANVVLIPRANGNLGIQEIGRVERDSPSVDVLDVSNVTRIGTYRLNLDVRNVYRVLWNVTAQGDITRQIVFVDDQSVEKWGSFDELLLRLPALHGTVSSVRTLEQIRDQLRGLYAQPEIELTVDFNSQGLALEPLDPVRVRLPVPDLGDPPDAGQPAKDLDRTMIVDSIRFDTQRLRGQAVLRGSLGLPLPVSTAGAAVMLDSYYAPSGNIVALSSISGVSIDGSGNLTGTGTITSPSGNSSEGATHEGDLTIADGAELIITRNARLMVRGLLTVNGTIRADQYIAGPVDGNPGLGTFFVRDPERWFRFVPAPPAAIPGYIGPVRAGDGVAINSGFQPPGVPREQRLRPPAGGSPRTEVGIFPLVNTGGTVLDPTALELNGSSGAPGGLLWVQGPQGGDVGYFQYKGGLAGDGASGGLIICRGMQLGPNGRIIMDGGEGGDADDTPTAPIISNERRGGGGAGGSAGALLILLDGDASIVPALRPTQEPNSQSFPVGDSFFARQGRGGEGWKGLRPEPVNQSGTGFRVQFIPAPAAPQPDRPSAPVSDYFETRNLFATFGQGFGVPWVEIIHVSRTGKIGIEIDFYVANSEAELQALDGGAGANVAHWIEIWRTGNFVIPPNPPPGFIYPRFQLRNAVFGYHSAGWSRTRAEGQLVESLRLSHQDRYGFVDDVPPDENFPGPGTYIYRFILKRSRIGALNDTPTPNPPTVPYEVGSPNFFPFPANGFFSVRTIELDYGR